MAILAVRNAELLAQSLASIRDHAAGEPTHQVVIVLNGATDEVRDCVRTHGHDAVVVDSPVNLGTGGGFNRAFAATDAHFMVIAHDDSQVTANWLSPLMECMDEDPSLGAVGGRVEGFDGRVQWMGALVFRDGATHPEWAGDVPPADLMHTPRDVDYHGGLGLLIRREAWEAVGGFDDTSYYPAYYPDTDLCFRLRAAGWRVRYEPGCVIRHHHARSTTAPFRTFLGARNRAVFAHIHADSLAGRGDLVLDDPGVLAAGVRRATATARQMPQAPRRADAGSAAVLRERLARSDLEYLAMERDVWRAFAANQTQQLEDERQRAIATSEDRDLWRAEAMDLSVRVDDLTTRLVETAAVLDGVSTSRWWRLGERLRRLRP